MLSPQRGKILFFGTVIMAFAVVTLNSSFQDQHTWKVKVEAGIRVRRQLKEDAVPTIITEKCIKALSVHSLAASASLKRNSDTDSFRSKIAKLRDVKKDIAEHEAPLQVQVSAHQPYALGVQVLWNELNRRMVTIAKNLTSTMKLNDGREMPLFGLGMWQAASGHKGPAESAVVSALKHGYRMIDTATLYGNQADVGEGLKRSGVKREDVFIVTKLWTNGYKSCQEEFKESLKQLDCGYIDLYLIHSPSAGRVLESYKAMMEFQQQGLIKSIGVSNFGIHHLEGIIKEGYPTPAVNQIELHPWMKRPELVNYCREKGIAVMGYSPLVKAERLKDPTIVHLAKKLNKTAGQVLIRYSVQMGYITIPKTQQEARIVENAQVFDWVIPDEEMDVLNSLPENSCTRNPALSPWKG